MSPPSALRPTLQKNKAQTNKAKAAMDNKIPLANCRFPSRIECHLLLDILGLCSTFDPLHAGLPAKLLRYEIEEDKCETLHDVVRRRGSEPLKLQHQTDPLKLENIYTLCKGESSKVCACALGSSTLLARSSAGRLCLFRYSRSESSASSSLKKGKQHKCYRYSKTTFPLLFWRH